MPSYQDNPALPAPFDATGSTVPSYHAPPTVPVQPELALPEFEFIDLIAMGALSRVYKAIHRPTGERVAVKVTQVGSSATSLLSRAEQEWRVLHSLAHPNIVRGHSFQSIGSCVFIVMDLVPGHSLDRMVRHGGPLSPRAAANATIQAARGLDCAHRASIVHRDVKPSNLLVDRSGRVKVIDFGMARLGWPGEDSITLVHDETLLGTVNFMAPEQAMDCHEVDGRADIYALGCTLYFLLTGRPPFSEGSVAVRLMKHREEAPQPLCSVDPDIPRPLALICERMMAKAPSDRYRSAGAVADELVGWILAPGDRGQSRAG